MNLSEYAGYDGIGLADLIRKKEVTAKEVAELVPAGFHKINPALNAIIEIYDDRVEEADQLLRPNKPFAGVPFLLKDFTDCAWQRRRRFDPDPGGLLRGCRIKAVTGACLLRTGL
jgi:hypothetical protein